MQDKKDKKSDFFSLLRDPLQLRFYRKENFEQVGSWDLSPRSIYILLSSTLLFFLVMSFLLFAFTPLQRLIPRLSSIENANQFIQLSNTLDDIEREITAQNTYNNALRKLLVGDESVDLENLEIIELASVPKNKPEAPKENSAVQDEKEPVKNVSAQTKTISKPLDIRTGSLFDDMTEIDFYEPLSGILSADFDPQLEHYGVDIIAPADTPVKVIRDGHVFLAEWNVRTGHTIGIQHDNNILSFYKHNSTLLKQKGQFVKGGEVIAIIGNSGHLTTGPHLHFEIWHNGKPVNPNDYIKLKDE